MKTDFSKKECDILVGLSDFKPRNQNQMADLIGSHEKSTDRVHVSRCLKNIDSYLKRVTNDLDESGKKWVLKHDIQTLRQIAEKYPSIIPDLQNNDKILDMLQDNHPELCINELPLEEREILKKIGHNALEIWDKEILLGKEEFKKYLKISPAFFEFCLLNDIKYIIQKVSDMYHDFASEYIFDDEKLEKIYGNNTPQLRARNILYKFCVIKDAL